MSGYVRYNVSAGTYNHRQYQTAHLQRNLHPENIYYLL